MHTGETGAYSSGALAIYTPDPDRTQGVSLFPCPICTTQAPPGEIFCPECGFLLGSTPGPEAPETTGVFVRDGAGVDYPLQVGRNQVGRENAEVVLRDATVSRRHAYIHVDDSGLVSVEDLGSTNGTKVAGRIVAPGQPARATEGDTLQFGNVRLTLQGARALAALPQYAGSDDKKDRAALPPPAGYDRVSPSALLVTTGGDVYSLTATTTTVGRRATNDIVLTGDPYVSGAHAQILFDGNSYRVADVGSTNGTRVNGRPIAANTPTEIVDGDEIAFGRTQMTFRRNP